MRIPPRCSDPPLCAMAPDPSMCCERGRRGVPAGGGIVRSVYRVISARGSRSPDPGELTLAHELDNVLQLPAQGATGKASRSRFRLLLRVKLVILAHALQHPVPGRPEPCRASHRASAVRHRCRASFVIRYEEADQSW